MKPLVFLFVLALGAGACSELAQAGVVSKHGDWTAFRNTDAHGPVCFAGSEPLKDEGDYTKRGDIYVLVTHRSQSGTLDVVSVEAGYNYQKGSDVTVKIGGQNITMFTSDGNAWARDAATDKKLVKAMKRGSTMIVSGRSSRGTATKDTYSLTGFTAAYNASRKACGL